MNCQLGPILKNEDITHLTNFKTSPGCHRKCMMWDSRQKRDLSPTLTNVTSQSLVSYLVTIHQEWKHQGTYGDANTSDEIGNLWGALEFPICSPQKATDHPFFVRHSIAVLLVLQEFQLIQYFFPDETGWLFIGPSASPKTHISYQRKRKDKGDYKASWVLFPKAFREPHREYVVSMVPGGMYVSKKKVRVR